MIQFPVSFKLIFKCIAGSHLYGTNTPDSDIDKRGVFIPDETYFYGFLNRIEQFEDKINDETYFEIRKFLQLAMANNPNIIELLFIPKINCLYQSDEWIEICRNRELFISKKCKHTFSGYAHAQFNKIKLHRNWLLNPPKEKPKREDFGLSPHTSDLSKDQIGAFNVLLSLKLKNIKELHPLKNQLDEMEETHDLKRLCTQYTEIDKDSVKKVMEISDKFLDILQKENAYLQAKNHYDQYQNWKKNRNPKRAELENKYGYDLKHAMHLCRLISEGEELLMTGHGHITFPRPDMKFLLEIKNGAYSYDEVFKLLESYDEKFNDLYEKTTLPYSANFVKIDELCRKIVKNFLLS